jgi:hypothetical protein
MREHVLCDLGAYKYISDLKLHSVNCVTKLSAYYTGVKIKLELFGEFGHEGCVSLQVYIEPGSSENGMMNLLDF